MTKTQTSLDDVLRPDPRFGVLLIDMQDFFLEELSDSDRRRIIESQGEVLEHCAAKDIPVAVVEYEWHRYNADRTIPKLRKRVLEVPRHRYLRKDSDDCFLYTRLDETLREWGVRHSFLMGVNASACVMVTGRSALRHGFKIATSSDVIADQASCKYTESSIEWYRKNGLFTDSCLRLFSQL